MAAVRAVFPEEPGRVAYSSFAYEAASGAHALLVVTEWDEFRQLDLDRVRGFMELPIIVDGRNFFDPKGIRKTGFEYYSIGR